MNEVRHNYYDYVRFQHVKPPFFLKYCPLEDVNIGKYAPSTYFSFREQVSFIIS